MTELLEATDVGFEIQGHRLVDDVSLHIDGGEVFAVVGPNGAGKSTLLRLLAGDLAPTVGSIALAGQPAQGASLGELALRRSFLGQHPATDVPFTVREVVAMGRYPHRARPENTAADDAAAAGAALEATDTEGLAQRAFSTLSGGEEQRVNVARILAQQTPVVLLDEPTTALDIAHRELIMRSLTTVAAKGSAVVTVLHDLNLAAVFADRVMLLSDGRVVATGTAREVLEEESLSRVYRHPVRVVDHPFRDGPLILPVDE